MNAEQLKFIAREIREYLTDAQTDLLREPKCVIEARIVHALKYSTQRELYPRDTKPEDPIPEGPWFERMKPIVLEIAESIDPASPKKNPILLCSLPRGSLDLAAAESAHYLAARILRGAVEMSPRCQSALATTVKPSAAAKDLLRSMGFTFLEDRP